MKRKYNKNLENKIIPSNYEDLENIIKKDLCIIQNHRLGIYGRGFICKLPFPDNYHLLPVLMSTTTILEEKDIQPKSKIKIILYYNVFELEITTKRKVFIDKNLDITIIEISPIIDGVNCFLEIDENMLNPELSEEYENKITSLYIGKSILIIKQSMSTNNESDCYEGEIQKISGSNLYHDTTIEKITSGEPIILQSNNKLIGINKVGILN